MRLDELVSQLGGLEVVRGATDTLEIGRVDVLIDGILATEGSVYLCASARLARRWLEENAARSVRACLIAPRSIRKLTWPASSMVVLAYKSEIIPLDLSARILRALFEHEHPATIDHEVLCRGLLERIFEGSLELTNAVKKAASTLGMDLESKHQVMLVVLDTPEALVDNGRELRSRLLSLVRAELLTDSRFHEVHGQPSGAVGLLDHRAERDSSQLLSTVSEHLRRIGVPFAIGLGGAYRDPKYRLTALARSHREAREALEVRQQAGLRQAWISYEQARPLILTKLISRDPRVLELVQQVLEPLLNTEPRYRRSLLEALHAYLEHRQSIQQAANELHIHPNTLKYRIQRLNDLLHLRDLSSDQRFLLLVAAKIVLQTGFSS
jgi:sugar diacid utilization regulator